MGSNYKTYVASSSTMKYIYQERMMVIYPLLYLHNNASDVDKYNETPLFVIIIWLELVNM